MTEVKDTIINRSVIENAYTYEEYRELINNLLLKGKTTGENHSEAMIHYTNMNSHRMRRIDKRIELIEPLKNRLDELKRAMTWVVLTEAWCGDAAQNLPVIQKIADSSSKIQTRYILRDENLEIMDQFLTNGRSRSIPKLICLDSQTLELLGHWGPRPAGADRLYSELTQQGLPYQEVAEKIHKWYADDKTATMQSELLHLLDEWE
tara:strand:- start:37222 stop:37839 length:618 start_codon:yes stop_codon:yes gene_type:complete